MDSHQWIPLHGSVTMTLEERRRLPASRTYMPFRADRRYYLSQRDGEGKTIKTLNIITHADTRWYHSHCNLWCLDHETNRISNYTLEGQRQYTYTRSSRCLSVDVV